MSQSAQFETKLLSPDGRNTGIEVAADVVEGFGVGKRVPVIVSVNGFTYNSTIASMGGKFLIPFSSDKRKATGLSAGDTITVELTLDAGPRTVDVPDDLAAALAAARVRDAFDALAYTHRKEHVRSVTEAKRAETRERRIAIVVASLGA